MMLTDFELTHGECQHSFFLGCKKCEECWVENETAEYLADLKAQEEAEFDAWIKSIEKQAREMRE